MEGKKQYLYPSIDDITLIIASFIPELLCYECGELIINGYICDCWKRRPIYSHPINDIYYLGLDCQSCTYGNDVCCTCYRVREKTECRNCRKKLSIEQYNSQIRYCSQECKNIFTATDILNGYESL